MSLFLHSANTFTTTPNTLISVASGQKVVITYLQIHNGNATTTLLKYGGTTLIGHNNVFGNPLTVDFGDSGFDCGDGNDITCESASGSITTRLDIVYRLVDTTT